MTTRVLKVLEYVKILNIISEMAVCSSAKKKVLEITPSNDYNHVSYMLDETDEALSMLLRRGNPPFVAISDITEGLKRASLGGYLNLSELLCVASVLRTTANIDKYISEAANLSILSGISKNLMPLGALEKEISNCILSEVEVADTASNALLTIRKRKTLLHNKIKDILSEMIHSTKYTKFLQDPIVTMRGDRYVLPVKSEHKSSVPGILHDSSATGATFFIEPMAVVQANNQLRDLALEERDEIERIIADLSAQVAEVSETILLNFNTLVSMDVLFAKAKFSLNYNCSAPQLNKEGYINIKQGRHPLINKTEVVPIDIYMGRDFDTLVITGPNTGGKTVTLKTVGLFSLMNQSGIQIPASSGTSMPVFDDIFADIGDEQSIEQSLSTFSSHMTNIVEILTNATRNSLVLFDELGAGTDPEEGAALAIEILEFTKRNGAKSIATTHYSELKIYALSNDRVENASCEFDVATLRPTYKLLIGIPGKSNAFAISKRLGLFDSIIEAAATHMSAESVQFEDIINELQIKREHAQATFDEANRLLSQAEKKLKDTDMENENIKNKKREVIDAARMEARSIVEKAKEETTAILKQAEQLALNISSREDVKKMEELRREIREKGKEIDSSLIEERKKNINHNPPKNLKLGNTVEILSLNDKGVVQSLPNKNGDFYVQIGIMKIKVNITDVRLIDDINNLKVVKKVMGERSFTSAKAKTVSMELDLRGQLVDDALLNLDRFVDDCVMSSLTNISVIHGKGTGALRSAVKTYLKTNKFVKSFRLGEYGEGDNGVTIIELK